jgi:hypothetical protein
MSRYAASAGIRDIQADSNDPKIAKQFPFLLIFGPSGQAATVPPPSGLAGSVHEFASEFQGWEHTYDHTALAWTKNEIVTSFRNTQGTVGTDWGFAWQPYGQYQGALKNDTNYDFEANVSLSDALMFDGFNWKIILPPLGSDKQMWSFKRATGGGAFWTGMHVSNFETPANYGLYDGNDPIRTGDKGGDSAPSGWRPLSGLLGKSPVDANYSAMHDADFDASVELGGVRSVESNVVGESTVLNDIEEFQGDIYYVTQHGMVGLRFGGKGQFIWSDKLFNDDRISTTTDAANYTSRLTKNFTGGSKSRSLTSHKGELFMLSNDGKVHAVTPHSLQQVADLSQLGTPWSSGIVGGVMDRVPAVAEGPFEGNPFRRCFITSFNNQLHAFLNFQTNFRMVKGVLDAAVTTGRGIFWATSFDGRNWADRSDSLPASGIVSPSGGAVTAGNVPAQVTNWISTITPYKFSGFTGAGVTPTPEASGQFPLAYGTVGIGGLDTASSVFPAQPSGYRQLDLPLWNSGIMVDANNTSFDQLHVPLEFGTISGFLFPTFVRYPAGFGQQFTASGDPFLFLPSGVGPSGYDYTGCNNYHISGFVDTQKDVLKLSFSEDFEDGGALTFELNKASGWNRSNYLPFSKQLNGYVPIMLYDPEVIIPSGGVLDPNPSVDEVNKTLTLKYRLYDWPFWDKVDVISEYSLDYGRSWVFLRRQKELSTGSPDSDPSGVIGTEHTLVWNWAQDDPHPISKNVWQPHVQIRLRAVDPDFNPSGVL